MPASDTTMRITADSSPDSRRMGNRSRTLDRAVDHHAHEQAVEHGHHGGFRGREPASAHAAQNQHRSGQAPGGFAQALPERRAGMAASSAPILCFGGPSTRRARSAQCRPARRAPCRLRTARAPRRRAPAPSR